MVTITLTPELEKVVIEQAQQQGTTPELLALDKLNEQFLSRPPAASSEEGNLADYLGDFIGCLDSGELVPGGARMSENIGEKFAEGMMQKRNEGRL
jgi:hypothetical protein